MRQYSPICECKNGVLADKVNLLPDFFSGFEAIRRKEIVTEEAAFYHGITAPYSVDDKLSKYTINVPVRDGYEVPVKIYRPICSNNVLPAWVFMHGGGFITCSVETHDFVPAYISANANVVSFNIEYRLAPEYKFPVGIQDCFDVALWISEHADELGIDKNHISVGGDSSGGNFAAVLPLMAKANPRFNIDKQVLIYPVTDMSGDIVKPSVVAYAPVGSADGESAGPDYLKAYTSPEDDLKNPLLSPLFAEDLSGLPEALFILAECDSLRDDGLYYAQALKESGVKVEYAIYEGMPHAFILRTYEETFAALNKICDFLR